MGDLQDQIKALNTQLKAKGEQTEMNIERAVLNAALRIEREVKLLMKNTPTMNLETRSAMVESGKRIGHKVGKTGKVHLPSEPGQAPAIDTATYVRSFSHVIENGGKTATVGTPQARGPALEFGTSKMLPRPHLGTAMRNTAEKNKRDFQLVMSSPSIQVESESSE